MEAIDEDAIIDIDILTSVCAGIVVIEEVGRLQAPIIRLVRTYASDAIWQISQCMLQIILPMNTSQNIVRNCFRMPIGGLQSHAWRMSLFTVHVTPGRSSGNCTTTIGQPSTFMLLDIGPCMPKFHR